MDINPLEAFKASSVPGLYSFNHFAHPDGRWIQVHVHGPSQGVVYRNSKDELHRFQSLEALKEFMLDET